MFNRRVVVTGLGVVTPVGGDTATFWAALVAGRSGAGPVMAYATPEPALSYAAEVKDFTPERAGLPRKRVKMMGRQAQLAFAAAAQAWQDAGLAGAGVPPGRVGLILGVGMLNADVTELGRAFDAMTRAGASGESDPVSFGRVGAPELFPLWLLRHIPNLAAAHASIALDAQGPSNTIATGCVAGANAIGEAARLVARGDADVVLAGGTDARVTPLGTLRYRELGWLATRSGVDPVTVSAPFDEHACGFVSGEGAGILVLESLEHAQSRGARIDAELLAYAAANDGGDPLVPNPEGTALEHAIARCLVRAELTAEAVDAVFAPAPSVPTLDRATAAALSRVFGRSGSRAGITATRSLLGHTHAASSALDCVAAVRSLGDGRIPAIANLHRPVADLPFVRGGARAAAVRSAVVGAYGFGGHAATLVFGGCGQ